MLIELSQNRAFLGNEKITSIYFGGGTPSLLTNREIDSFLELITKEFNLEKDIEITLEANPDDLTGQKIAELKKAGINRLSIGVQSFFDKDLKMLNRAHDAKMAVSCIENVLKEGFDNFTIDLIYGLPESTLQDWEDNLTLFLSFDIPHLSAYSLTYEDRTAFGNWVKKGNLTPLEESLTVAQFKYLMNQMNQAGYEQYEISNFAKSGKQSRHNSSYWLGEPYLGCGPSAHSFNGEIRRWNASNNSKYVKAIEEGEIAYEQESLTLKDHFNEYLLTSLRTSWGCDLKVMEQRFGRLKVSEFKNECVPFLDKSLLTFNGSAVILTEKGKLVADMITSDLFTV